MSVSAGLVPIPYSRMFPLLSTESSTSMGFSVELQVGVPPPPFPQILFDEELRRNRAPLPAMLQGTAGEQLAIAVATNANSNNINSKFNLFVIVLVTLQFMALHSMCLV